MLILNFIYQLLHLGVRGLFVQKVMVDDLDEFSHSRTTYKGHIEADVAGDQMCTLKLSLNPDMNEADPILRWHPGIFKFHQHFMQCFGRIL